MNIVSTSFSEFQVTVLPGNDVLLIQLLPLNGQFVFYKRSFGNELYIGFDNHHPTVTSYDLVLSDSLSVFSCPIIPGRINICCSNTLGLISGLIRYETP